MATQTAPTQSQSQSQSKAYSQSQSYQQSEPQSQSQSQSQTQSQSDLEAQEAKEYWGYLFKADKTGTDKLKNLLRGLHHIIATDFEPSDSADITPAQVAHFYRSLNGNYDPLFLSTPPASIAFIYKNLGCLHSLQPLHSASNESRFSDPTVPALKVEGWIMWQTIQLLLGPEEHSGFLREAVQKWDVKDPETGEVLPKVLPRSCFPTSPDSHMVAWYEGVSERLRREAEDEQKMRITEAEEPNDTAQYGDEDDRRHRRRERNHNRLLPETEQSESRRSALAYFRNPLFRENDGRPSVVRRNSRQPPTSPRPSGVMEKGRQAATSVGHVVRNIASPHLWDGASSREKEKEHEKEKEKRRRSLPHNHRHSHNGDAADDEGTSSPNPYSRHGSGHNRRDSSQVSSPASAWENWDNSDVSRRSPRHERPSNRRQTSDRSVRHSKSHEPASSPREYFPNYDKYHERRGSNYSHAESPMSPSTPQQQSGQSQQGQQSQQQDESSSILHPGFMPSASPLFATQVAKSDRTAYYRPPRQTQPPRQTLQARSDGEDGRRSSRPKVTRFDAPPAEQSPSKQRDHDRSRRG